MKKLLFAFMAVVTLAVTTGCSDDDSNPYAFTSSIKIDDKDFSPTVDKNGMYVTTAFIPATGNGQNSRMFSLQKGNSNDVNSEQILISVNYGNLSDKKEDKIDGTYFFGGFEIENARFDYGNYFSPTGTFSFLDGSVTVTDLGNNRYKLIFNTVKGEDVLLEGDTSSPVVITGSFEGKFLELPQM